MKRLLVWCAALCGGAVTVACQPDSITEARDQLGRGGTRALSFTIPIRSDTLTVGDILADFAGLTVGELGDGIISVAIDPESIQVDVGQELKFDNLGFDQFVFSFDQMLETSEVSTAVEINLAAPAGGAPAGAAPPGAAQQQQDTIRFTTPDGSKVRSATVDTGWVTRRLTNNTICNGTLTMALKDAAGATVAAFPDTPVGAGQTVRDSVFMDDVTVSQFVSVELDGSAQAGCFPGFGELANAEVTFRPMLLAEVVLDNVQEDFTQTYDVLAGEDRISVIDTVVVGTGSFTITAQNKLPVSLAVDLTLNGIRDAAGNTLTASLAVAAAPGDGSTTSGNVTIDLTGATIVPADAVASVTGAASAASATINPTVAGNAVVVDGGGSLQVGRLVGTLDPNRTPELNIAIEETQEVPRGNLDLGQFEDVVRDATLNTVQLGLTIVNDADVPVTLSDFRIGAVRTNPATGQPNTKPSGALDLETDGAGDPIVVDTTLTIVRAGTTLVTLRNAATAALVDRLVDLLLDDVRVAIAGTGTAVVGDGSAARITSADGVSIVFALDVGLDFTLPAAGVEFDSSTVQNGLDLDPQDADEIASRVDTASMTLRVDNGTPFELRAEIAVVTDSVAGDVFQALGRVELDPLAVAAASVDANGRVVTPATSTVTVSLTGQEAKVFFGEKFTAGVRVRLLPPAGGQRGALRSADQIVVRSSARVKIRTGGAQ